jgi:2-succinyl-5-enolpyruvyl-6-hydroxy-3-cyclohexene-1-carboxylate synthase
MARTAAQAVFDHLALHGVERLCCAPGAGLQKVKR